MNPRRRRLARQRRKLRRDVARFLGGTTLGARQLRKALAFTAAEDIRANALVAVRRDGKAVRA